MIVRLVSLLLLALTLWAPGLWAQNPNTAKYPSALPADTDLLVAKNRLDAALTLSSTIDGSTLTIAVNDGSLVPIPGVVRIDYELIKICSRVGNTLSACSGGRGFDGSVAQSHSAGATISNVISAWYHNQLAAEIIAITTRLGTGFNGQALSTTQITTGQLTLARGGTGADLSATGGASYVLRQSSAGAAVTVSQLAASDLSNGTTGSGSVVLASSPTIVTPTIASFANATHTHQNSAGGGTLVGASALSDYATAFVNSLTGTTKRVTVSAANGSVTLSGPQDLDTSATPTFGGLALGVSSRLTALHVGTSSTSSPRGILSAQYSTGTDGARVGFMKARGTEASPTTVVTGDTLGRLMFRGYDGSNYLEMASIEVVSAGTIASTRVPTYMAFSTATDAAPSVLTEAMRITQAQRVGVGTNDPKTLLQVSGGYFQVGASNFADQGFGVAINAAGNRALYYSRSTDTGNKAWVFGNGAGSIGAANFAIYNASDVLTAQFAITAGGNVLIGTTTDGGAYKLKVAGAAYASTLDTNNGGGVWQISSDTTADGFYVYQASIPNLGYGLIVKNTTGNVVLGTTTEGNYKLDVARSGSSGTLRVYDQTATTGVTQAVIRAGAGQSTTDLQQWQDNSGSWLSRLSSSIVEFKQKTFTFGVLASTEDVAFELGSGRTGNGATYIDLKGDATYTDYGFRVIRGNTGANASSLLLHRGTGGFYLSAEDAGAVIITANAAERFRGNATGISFFGATPVARQTATADAASILALLQAYGLSN